MRCAYTTLPGALALSEVTDLGIGIDFIVNPHTGEAYAVLGMGL